MAFPDFLANIEEMQARRQWQAQRPQQPPQEQAPTTAFGRQIAAPLSAGYSPPSIFPQGELYPSQPQQQNANPLLQGGAAPQMPWHGSQQPEPPQGSGLMDALNGISSLRNVTPNPRFGWTGGDRPNAASAVPQPSLGYQRPTEPPIPGGLIRANPAAGNPWSGEQQQGVGALQSLMNLAQQRAQQANAPAAAPGAPTVTEGGYGPWQRLANGVHFQDAPNPAGFTPVDVSQFMDKPRSAEQRLSDMANGNNGYVNNSNGRGTFPTINAEQRAGAVEALAKLQAGREQQASSTASAERVAEIQNRGQNAVRPAEQAQLVSAEEAAIRAEPGNSNMQPDALTREAVRRVTQRQAGISSTGSGASGSGSQPRTLASTGGDNPGARMAALMASDPNMSGPEFSRLFDEVSGHFGPAVMDPLLQGSMREQAFPALFSPTFTFGRSGRSTPAQDAIAAMRNEHLRRGQPFYGTRPGSAGPLRSLLGGQ